MILRPYPPKSPKWSLRIDLIHSDDIVNGFFICLVNQHTRLIESSPSQPQQRTPGLRPDFHQNFHAFITVVLNTKPAQNCIVPGRLGLFDQFIQTLIKINWMIGKGWGSG